MNPIRSWAALLNREYLEHRMSFVYFPIGILVLLALSGASSLAFNRARIELDITIPPTLKIFELGYLALALMWLAYLSVALFFYFGDAFAADRRNNAMFFWKSMPVSDLKMLISKFLAGVLLFPAILFLVTMVSGLLWFVMMNVAAFMVPGLLIPAPLTTLVSFLNISVFVVVYTVFALLWFAPFLAWVGGLSAVFGRWSLVLAFLIPGLLAVIENVALFGYGPRGGYVWAYLSQRLHFGLEEPDLIPLLTSPGNFSVAEYTARLMGHIDWTNMAIGFVFTAAALWAASEYRRRRIA